MLFSHVPIDVTWLEQFAKEAVDVLDVEVECVAFIAYASVADWACVENTSGTVSESESEFENPGGSGPK